MSDIDITAVDSLKALDPKRPIREADIPTALMNVCFRGQSGRWRYQTVITECSDTETHARSYCITVSQNHEGAGVGTQFSFVEEEAASTITYPLNVGPALGTISP